MELSVCKKEEECPRERLPLETPGQPRGGGGLAAQPTGCVGEAH